MTKRNPVQLLRAALLACFFIPALCLPTAHARDIDPTMEFLAVRQLATGFNNWEIAQKLRDVALQFPEHDYAGPAYFDYLAVREYAHYGVYGTGLAPTSWPERDDDWNLFFETWPKYEQDWRIWFERGLAELGPFYPEIMHNTTVSRYHRAEKWFLRARDLLDPNAERQWWDFIDFEEPNLADIGMSWNRWPDGPVRPIVDWYLGLIYEHTGREDKALELFKEVDSARSIYEKRNIYFPDLVEEFFLDLEIRIYRLERGM